MNTSHTIKTIVNPDGSKEKVTRFYESDGMYRRLLRTHFKTIRGPTIPVKYSKNPKCKTNGAIFVTGVHSATFEEPARVTVEVRLPANVKLSKKDAIEIEEKSHEFFESLLAKHFK